MTRRVRFVLASALLAPAVVVAQTPAPPKPLEPVPGFGQPATPPVANPPATPPTTPAAVVPTGGQTPPPQPKAVVPAPTPPDAATVAHLEGWEKAMKEVKTYYAAATMTESVPKLKREVKFDVNMWLMTPTLARMDMAKAPPPGKPAGPAEKMIISTGKTIYEYDGARKVRTSAGLGPGGAGNNLLLDLMAGMSPKQVTDRFTVTTAKQDADFVFLEVKPVFPSDKEEFDKLTLVLCGAKFKERTYIPRMIILSRPDGQTTETWDFPDPKVNPKGIDAGTFTPVDLPKDWKDDRRELPKGATTGGLKAPTPK